MPRNRQGTCPSIASMSSTHGLWRRSVIKGMRLHPNMHNTNTREEAKGQDGEDMEIVDLSLTNRADVMSAENGTAVNNCIFNVYVFYHADSFMRIEPSEGQEIPLRSAIFWCVTSLPALFCIHRFNDFRGTLSLTIHLRLVADFVTTPLTDGTTVGRDVLSTSGKVVVLYGRYRLDGMRHQHAGAK